MRPTKSVMTSFSHGLTVHEILSVHIAYPGDVDGFIQIRG